MRTPPRLPSLFLGLLCVAVAAVYLLSIEGGGANLDPAIVWPIVIIGIGTAGLLALVGPADRGEAGADDGPPDPAGDPTDRERAD